MRRSFRIKDGVKLGLDRTGVWRLLHQHRRKAPDIFLFSTPRSGSTWLLEMLATQPRVQTIDEPLHPHSVERRFGPDYSHFRHFPDSAFFPNMYDYINGLGDGTILHGGYAALRTTRHRMVADRSAFKILRAASLLDWFYTNLPGHYIVLLRHPIPTALSRMRNEWGHHVDEYMASDYYRLAYLDKDMLNIVQRTGESGSDLERFVIGWCLDNLPLLRCARQEGIPIVTYEQIVADPETAITNIADALHLEQVDKMLKRIGTASSSTKFSNIKTRQDIVSGNTEGILDKWRDEVDAATERRLLSIVQEFGIDLYGYDESIAP